MQSGNILITGFGCFRKHTQNPSFEAIRDGKIKIKSEKFKVITKQIEVSYHDVDDVFTKLYQEYKPSLIVLIGLADHETAIRIETTARLGPYLHDDVKQFAPHEHLREYGQDKKSVEDNVVVRDYACKPCVFDCFKTKVDVEKLCDKMNDLFLEGKLKIPTRKSDDAGLYLCEYIYQHAMKLCELNEMDTKCVFVHVPNTDRFSLDDITACIQQVVELLIE